MNRDQTETRNASSAEVHTSVYSLAVKLRSLLQERNWTGIVDETEDIISDYLTHGNNRRFLLLKNSQNTDALPRIAKLFFIAFKNNERHPQEILGKYREGCGSEDLFNYLKYAFLKEEITSGRVAPNYELYGEHVYQIERIVNNGTDELSPMQALLCDVLLGATLCMARYGLKLNRQSKREMDTLACKAEYRCPMNDFMNLRKQVIATCRYFKS